MRALHFTDTIGAGAFGTVYLAELSTDQGFRRQVAVKIVLQDHADKEMFISRMRDEARLLGLLQDDHVLKVIDLLNINGRDAIVMEYIEGIDLSAAIGSRLLPSVRCALEIGAVVAGTLDRAHKAHHPISGDALGVVHRDVKPANVMVTASGSIKLLDFGIAQARFAARESQTGQMVLGTLNYMAPDYVITGEVTPALDVYGLALTMYELVAGQLFGQPKLREDQHQERLQHRMTAIAENHPQLAAFLARMLDWEPGNRPSCGECAKVFADLADEATGPGLRRWADGTVSNLLAARPTAPDSEHLLGQTFQMGASTLPAPETPIAHDSAGPTDASDAPTTIQSKEALHAQLDLPTGEVAQEAPFAQPHLSKTKKAVTSSIDVEKMSIKTAVLRGAFVGGIVGTLAVIVLAVVLYWGFPPPVP